ncbi:MAG: twin-arginine translocase subunit TatC [Planctomycetes bacterium]|nr:twin-arginine translocase subunit TatC [Planctomycetota bacterium]
MAENQETKEKRLPVSEHLEELRSRIIKSIIVVAGFFFISWVFKSKILDIVKKPHNFAMENLGLPQSLQVLSYQEGFYAYIKLCLITAIFMAYPVIVYQIWKFVGAGLYKKERRYVLIFIPFSLVAFVAGVLFGYFFLIPFGLQFLIKILGSSVEPVITMSQYISLVFLLTIALGIVFQLPLVMLFIGKIGVLKADDFAKWRKYALLIMFVLAAIITPPDPFTQVMTALPMIALYEIGIILIQPTKKAVVRFCMLLGVGAVVVYTIFLVFTFPTKARLIHSTGLVKVLPSVDKQWRALTDKSNIQNGAILQTGRGSKASFALHDGTYIIMDVDTNIKLVEKRKFDIARGQILAKITTGKEPFTVTAHNSTVSVNDAEIDIKVSEFVILITPTRGSATVATGGKEQEVLEGRQLKIITGGIPVDTKSVTKWAGEMQKRIQEDKENAEKE